MSNNIKCFHKDEIYNRFKLGLNLSELKALEILDEKKTFVALVILYLTIALLIFVSIKLTHYNFLFYVPCIFLIAGRQGAFVQLVHEASHFLVSKNNKLNDFFGNYLCAFPIGVNFAGFRSGHNNHHVNTATPNDSPTDLDKYRVVDTKKFDLYKLFIKDLVGISALEVFLSYGKNKTDTVNIEKKSKKKIFSIFNKIKSYSIVNTCFVWV